MQLLASLCVLLLLGLCAEARAECAWSTEEPCPPEQVDASRTLNGHVFVPFRLQPWTFVTTRVSSRTGIGVNRLTSIPVLNAGVISQDATLVSFAQAFDLDVKLAPFIALSTGFTVGHAAGINESGAFNLGLNYAFGGSLGAILRLAHGPNWYFGMRGDFAWSRAEAVLPVALTESATVNEEGLVTFDLGALTQGGSFRRGTAELAFSLSPLRWLGLQANVGFDSLRSEAEGRERQQQTITGGFGGSLRPRRVPLAFLLGAETRIRLDDEAPAFFPTISSGGDFIWQVELGVFYSDPEYVDVGLQSWFQTDDDDHRTQFQIIVNHVW